MNRSLIAFGYLWSPLRGEINDADSMEWGKLQYNKHNNLQAFEEIIVIPLQFNTLFAKLDSRNYRIFGVNFTSEWIPHRRLVS